MAAVRARNLRLALVLVLVVAGMVGLAFAAVPLYRLFCQVTGFGGTTRVAVMASMPKTPIAARVAVDFDANVAPDLPWRFQAPQPIELRLGEQGHAVYTARNRGDRPILGTATFNVTPFKAGKYFNKVECFCFTEQVLRPGEAKDFPVTFFVDPALADDPDARDVTAITLSYTFFNAGSEALARYLEKNPTAGRPKEERK
jgi:cytochrome c oxidase assembly protein subunit 11